MATLLQIANYNALCEQLGQVPDKEFKNYSRREADYTIAELKEMLMVLEGEK